MGIKDKVKKIFGDEEIVDDLLAHELHHDNTIKKGFVYVIIDGEKVLVPPHIAINIKESQSK